MAQYGYPNPHKDPKTLPKKKETIKEKILRVLKETTGTFSGTGPD